MSLDWIYDWALAALPEYGAENIYRAKQSIIIPTDPALVYDLISADLSSYETPTDSALYPDPDPVVVPTPVGTFDRTYAQKIPVQMQIDCYSPNGLSDLHRLISFARSTAAKEIFDSYHVGFLGAGSVKNLTYLSDNDFRDRWNVTIDFMVSLSRTETLNAILEWRIGNETSEIETTIVA